MGSVKSAREIIERYSHLSLSGANEAETRKKVIDEILEKILGWTLDDISYEERVSEDGNTTFSDYIIRTADTAILVEAKRVGVTFDTVPDKRRAPLTGRLMEGKTGEAIKQAREYCRKKSIPFAVVTNGDQWIVFPGVRTDQISFSDSRAIIFDSLPTLLGEDLSYFERLLSREGVIEGNLAVELLGRNEDQFEERRLNKFFSGPVNKDPNPIFPLIENEVTTAFSESIVHADTDLLEKCYVKNADRQKFDNRIKMHLQKREPLFSSKPKRPMRKKESRALVESIGSAVQANRPLAMLVLGSVGTGKTTFLQYTRRVSAEEYFRKDPGKAYPHWVNIDFRDFSQSESPLDFIYKKVFEYLKKDDYFKDYKRSIGPAYKDEIEALRSGPMFLVAQDEEGFNGKVAEMITNDYTAIFPYVDKVVAYGATKAPLFLTIDNVDQFESEEVQSSIFSDAIALASRLRINLIIAMRESTYVNHRNSPTFDAFDFDPIHIEPPEISAVISRRFFLTGQLLKGKEGEFTARNGALFKVSDLSVFIDIVKSSVLGTEVGERIDVLANNDVRLALRMTREFLARGYTDPAKAISNYRRDGRYVLPKQEAFKSILLGNQSVYSEKYSVIGNPFDSRIGRSNGELLRLYVLSALVKKGSEDGEAYIEGPVIRENLNAIGFSESDTLEVLSGLCNIRFAHTRSYGPAEINSSFFSSRLGGHVVRNLIGDFTFIENVLMDTFVPGKSYWEELKELSRDISDERDIVQRIKLRATRAKTFYDHMKEQYKPLYDESVRRALDSTWLGNPLIEMEETLDRNLEKAVRSANKLYGEDGKRKER